MAWLDRDRMPVRFTVVTSVASGLEKMHRGRAIPTRTILHAEIYEND